MKLSANFALLCTTVAFSCSIPDPGAVSELEHAVQGLDAATHKVLLDWAIRNRVKRVLLKRTKKNTNVDSVMKIRCVPPKPVWWDEDHNGEWNQPWRWVDLKPEQSMSVADMLVCLGGGGTYISCAAEFWQKKMTVEPQGNAQPWWANTDGKKCEPRWVFGFEPRAVYEAAIDIAEEKDGADDKFYVGQASDDIVVQELISTPTPPPLPGGPAAWQALKILPLLCAESAGSWGCPSNPSYPGAVPAPSDDGADQ